MGVVVGGGGGRIKCTQGKTATDLIRQLEEGVVGGGGRIKCTQGKTATDLIIQLEYVFAVLKFIFSTQRNSFSVIDFLTTNLLLQSNIT